jgi:hypothetical protein
MVDVILRPIKPNYCQSKRPAILWQIRKKKSQEESTSLVGEVNEIQGK